MTTTSRIRRPAARRSRKPGVAVASLGSDRPGPGPEACAARSSPWPSRHPGVGDDGIRDRPTPLREFSTGFAGHTAFVPEDRVPSPRILRDNGYNTPAFGKWHLTPDTQQGPSGPFDGWGVSWGFDYYFYGFLGGGASQWDPCLTENQTIIGTTGHEENQLP